MKKIFLIMLIVTPSYLGAGGTDGGTPPAREKLKEQLMSAEFASGALFDKGMGDVGLLTNRELQPQMTLSKFKLSGSDIKIPEADFEMLRERIAPLDSVGTLGENRSFRLSAGDQLDSLLLMDRRAAARAAVAQ